MKVYCPNCTHQISENEIFCENCGVKLDQANQKDAVFENSEEIKSKLNLFQLVLFILITSLFLIAISWPKFHTQSNFSTNIIIGTLVFTIILLVLNLTSINLKNVLLAIYFLGCLFSLLQFNAVSFIISVVGAYFSSSQVKFNFIAKKKQQEELDKEKTKAIENIIFKA